MNRIVKCFALSALAALMLIGAPALAQSKEDLEQKILQEVASGRSADELIRQYRAQHEPEGSIRPDRAVEIRQLRDAERELAGALQAASRAQSHADLHKRAFMAYQQWKAAVLVIEAREKSVEGKLAESEAGAAYLARHKDVARSHHSRREKIRQLLDPYFGKESEKSGAKLSASDRQSIAAALALLASKKTGADPILRAATLPVASLNLPTRAPKLSPAIVPSYATATEVAVATEDTSDSGEAPLSDELIQKAKSFENDYVRIYEFVRNTIRTEWYAGSVKGAPGTLRSGAGNDIDQASLLIGLLRAAGVPARYVHGVIELPVEKIAADLGLQDKSLVPSALTKAGIAYTSIARGGRVAAVQVEHAWVAALVPYTNYRGAVVDASGKTWIPLDPSFKEAKWTPSSLQLKTAGTAADLQAAYLAQPQTQSFADFVKKRMTDAVEASGGGPVDYAAQLGKYDITALNLSLLPNSLPYPVIAVTRESARLAEADTARARVVLRAGAKTSDPVVLDAYVPLHEVANQRFTLSYLPASLEDHRLTLSFGGMDLVPMYLIQLRPQISVGGKVRSIAKESVSPGSDLLLEIEILGPFGSQRITHTVLAGAYQAMTLASSTVSRPEAAEASDTETQAARLLDGIGVAYNKAWTEGEAQFAALTGVRPVYPVPSVSIVTNHMEAEYVDDTPYTLEWKGVTLHAATHPVDAVGASAKDFLSLSGLHGSSLEYRTFESQFAVNAISADKGLALAREQGQEILSLTGSNVSAIDASDHAQAVKDDIKNWTRLGYRVDVPKNRLTYDDWSGSTWSAVDPATGAAGYFISGGLAGGATASRGDAWTLGFLADALRAWNSDPNNNDPLAGVKLYMIGAGDNQTGKVNQALPQRLAVRVVDRNEAPVRGALVTFQVAGGGGTLDNGGTVYQRVTDAFGIASTRLKLGQKTDANPRYVYARPGDKYPTRVGWNIVDVTAVSSKGTLFTEGPFTAIAYPDAIADLKRKTAEVTQGTSSEWVDSIGIGADDQYGNPIPNVSINFSISTQSVCTSDKTAEYFKQGAVFNNAINSDEGNTCPVRNPILGDCGSSSISKKTTTDGIAMAGVILGNDIVGINTLNVSGGGFSKTFTYTAWGYCGDRYSTPVYYAELSVGGAIIDGEGNNISAAAISKDYKRDIRTVLRKSEWPYELRNGRLYFHPYPSDVKTSGNVNVTASNGGHIAWTVAGVVGEFDSRLRVGATPAPNDITVNASDIPVQIPEIKDGVLQIRTETLNINTQGPRIFAVRPQIETLISSGNPAGMPLDRVMLDDMGRNAGQLELRYRINPGEYKTGAIDLDLYENGGWKGYVVGNSKQGVGSAFIPRGVQFDLQKRYEAELVLNRGSLVEVRSDRFNLATRQKLIRYVNDRRADAKLDVDIMNKRVCARPGVFGFGFTQPVVATLKLENLDAAGVPIGSPHVVFSDKSHSGGDFEIQIQANEVGTGEFRYTLTAVAANDASQMEQESGKLKSIYQHTNRLPVGQVMVKGVNVKMGTLVAQTQSIALAGRLPAMRFQPTYSTGSNGEQSTMGTNWTHNFDSGIHINGCGEVIVSGGDAGSVRFFPGEGGKLVPDLGYHATLEKNDADNSFDFYSKDGTRYHYKFMNRGFQWKLDFIEDTNGNKATLNYDMDAIPEPLLVNVTDSMGRQINFTYLDRLSDPGAPRQGKERHFLKDVTGPGGLKMEFTYDEYGNLLTANRNGRTEKFAYFTEEMDLRARGLMKSYTDPNGNATEYIFNKQSIEFSPETGVTILVPNSFVEQVKTPSGSVNFSFDIATFMNTDVTDENGKKTSYSLNMYGSPLSITDPAGTTTMTWATNDVTMLSKTDGRGVTTSYTYDEHGNMLTETVGGYTTRKTYLVQGAKPFIKNRVKSVTDRNSNRTEYDYDGSGNLIAESLPEGVRIKHTYARSGDRLQTTDGEGGITSFSYDGNGNLIGTTNPVAAMVKLARDARGRVTKSSDALGNTTTFNYDDQDRLVSRTDARGKARSMTYDENGNKLSETDEEGRTTRWEYNGINLPTKLINADGKSKTITYDGVGNKTSETDFRGNLTTYEYDGASRLTKRIEPLGKITQYAYDAVGNVTSETDGLNRVTTHVYDDLSRRTKTTDADSGVWAMSYDGNGNKMGSTDPLLRTTSFSYDGLNRLRSVTQPLGRVTTSTYDKNGNKLTETDANNNTTSYTYDAANRLVKETNAAGKHVSYEYDKNNNLLKTIDPGLNVTLYSYDALNRKRDMKDGEGYVTAYGYDDVGNLTEERLPNGNVISRSYDALNRPVSASDQLGTLSSMTYDADGNKSSETDANGNTSRHAYNALNQLTSSEMPESRNFAYGYDLMGNRTSMVDARNFTTTYKYDALNRLVEIIDPLLGVQKSAYDKVGNKLSETDRRNYTTNYVYDDLNRLVKVTDALNQTVTMTYDAAGNKLTETDKRGIVTGYKYDRLNRPTQVSKDGVVLSKTQYDDIGNVLFTTDANGNTTSYSYDKRNLRTSENRLLAAITRFKLDGMGDAIETIDPEGRKTTVSFDKRRRQVAVTNHALETTIYTYDGVGNRLTTKRPKGNVATNAYDRANRLFRVEDSMQGLTQYVYDKAGNVVSATDARSNTTGYDYDALNRRTAINYPGGASETFGYDANGNQTRHTDANGIVVSRSFDELNREVSKTYSSSADGLSAIATQYDAHNNVIQVTQTVNGVSRTSSFQYDNFDRQQKRADPFGAQAVTTYDANGNKTSLITQDGKITRYSYDALNRLTGIVGQSGTISYSYDRSSLNTRIAYSNGVASDMVYDAARRVKSVKHGKTGVNHSTTDYEYDKNGNRTRETINRVGGAQATEYAYDDNDRLTRTTLTNTAKTIVTEYALDAVANRIGETVTTTPAGGAATAASRAYTYDGRNQLTAITDPVAGNIELIYDPQGNLVQKTQGGDVTIYRYNARDNLISVSKNGTVLGNYGNDHLGLRVEKEAKDPLQPNAPPVTLRTLWDGRIAFQDSATDGSVVARYETDGKRVVSMWSRDDGSQMLHKDALGSIVATTDAAGNLKSETIYDAWGNVITETGSSANKFGYTGHQMDDESGLVYFQARYYDPSTGRFITQDPFEGMWTTPLSLHHYLYAYGNPTFYVDLYGYNNAEALGIDDASVEKSLKEDNPIWGGVKYAAKSTFYEVWNFGTGGFVKRHDNRLTLRDQGKITQEQFEKALVLDAATSIAASVAGGAAGGKVAGALASRGTNKILTNAATGAAYAGTQNAIEQAGEIAQHHGISDKLGRAEFSPAEVALSAGIGAGLGAGLPAIGKAISESKAGQAVAKAFGREDVEVAVPKTPVSKGTAEGNTSPGLAATAQHVPEQRSVVASASNEVAEQPVISIFGFRGQGNPKTDLKVDNAPNPLLVTGHVGISTDQGTKMIAGFNPHAPGMEAHEVVDSLLKGKSYPGLLTNDYQTFAEAATRTGIARGGSPDVYKMDIPVSQEKFNEISEFIRKNLDQPMPSRPYAFPGHGGECARNCATFPGTLGLPLPEETGSIRKYIDALSKKGQIWTPPK